MTQDAAGNGNAFGDGSELAVALVGTGVMGEDHARRIVERMPGIRLVSVCDIDPDRASKVAALAPGCRTNTDALAEIASPDVDAVIIASPGFTHEALVHAAIAAGKPVFCEKPLTPAADSSLGIVEAELAIGKRLVQVGFMRRYDPGFRQIRDLAESDELGPIRMLHCAHRAASVPGDPQPEFLVYDCLVHEFDQVRWLTGREISSVQIVRHTTEAHPLGEARCPLLAVIELDNGIIVSVEVNVFAGLGYEVRCEAVFADGAVTAGAAAAQSSIAVSAAGSAKNEITSDFRARFAAAYEEQMRDWAKAAAQGGASGASAWDGYVAAVAIDAGLQSQVDGARHVVLQRERPELYR